MDTDETASRRRTDKHYEALANCEKVKNNLHAITSLCTIQIWQPQDVSLFKYNILKLGKTFVVLSNITLSLWHTVID